jgi:hypothetical protein
MAGTVPRMAALDDVDEPLPEEVPLPPLPLPS